MILDEHEGGEVMMVVTLKIFTILMQTIMMITPAYSPTVSIFSPDKMW